MSRISSHSLFSVLALDSGNARLFCPGPDEICHTTTLVCQRITPLLTRWLQTRDLPRQRLRAKMAFACPYAATRGVGPCLADARVRQPPCQLWRPGSEPDCCANPSGRGRTEAGKLLNEGTREHQLLLTWAAGWRSRAAKDDPTLKQLDCCPANPN